MSESDSIVTSSNTSRVFEQGFSSNSPLNVDSTTDTPIYKVVDVYERCSFAIIKPSNFQEAAKLVEWVVAMKEEMEMINKNDTWDLVEKPKDEKTIGVK